MISTSRNLLVRATLPVDSPVDAPPAMLVFAHPDDEVIGLGARLARYQSAIVVHVTDGAPRNAHEIHSQGFARREDYLACRDRELEGAFRLAGLKSAQRICLEIPDQEVSLHLADLANELHRLFVLYAPEAVFTHPYEGGHPDHDACAFAVERAAARARAGGKCSPTILESTFYHLGPGGMETGCFLRRPESTGEILWPLTQRERKHKQALLACFPSQQEALRYVVPEQERFRVAPKYLFDEPPHPGPLFYESQSLGMTAQRFCELVKAADAAELAEAR